MFRARRVAEVLHGVRMRPATKVLAAMREAVERFTARINHEDDLTVVVVRRDAGGLVPMAKARYSAELYRA
jgi:hypothetical protein